MWGSDNGSVTIHRTGFYSCEYRLTPLAEVAGKTRTMPAEFIDESGTGVTDGVPHVPPPAARLGHAGGAPAATESGGEGAGSGRRRLTRPVRTWSTARVMVQCRRDAVVGFLRHGRAGSPSGSRPRRCRRERCRHCGRRADLSRHPRAGRNVVRADRGGHRPCRDPRRFPNSRPHRRANLCCARHTASLSARSCAAPPNDPAPRSARREPARPAPFRGSQVSKQPPWSLWVGKAHGTETWSDLLKRSGSQPW